MRIGRTSVLELAVIGLVWVIVPTLLVGWVWAFVWGVALLTGGLLALAGHFIRPYP